MLKIILVILALSASGQPFEAAVPVETIQECAEKGTKWVSQDPATVGAKRLGFVCVVSDERPQA